MSDVQFVLILAFISGAIVIQFVVISRTLKLMLDAMSSGIKLDTAKMVGIAAQDTRAEMGRIWDEKMGNTIETLTSDDIIAETMAIMSDEQMDRLASKVEELRNKNE